MNDQAFEAPRGPLQSYDAIVIGAEIAGPGMLDAVRELGGPWIPKTYY